MQKKNLVQIEIMYWIPIILECISFSLSFDSLGLIICYIIWQDRNQNQVINYISQTYAGKLYLKVECYY